MPIRKELADFGGSLLQDFNYKVLIGDQNLRSSYKFSVSNHELKPSVLYIHC